jgi:hypothetical protein
VLISPQNIAQLVKEGRAVIQPGTLNSVFTPRQVLEQGGERPDVSFGAEDASRKYLAAQADVDLTRGTSSPPGAASPEAASAPAPANYPAANPAAAHQAALLLGQIGSGVERTPELLNNVVDGDAGESERLQLNAFSLASPGIAWRAKGAYFALAAIALLGLTYLQ